jgi:hypothetical protein
VLAVFWIFGPLLDLPQVFRRQADLALFEAPEHQIFLLELGWRNLTPAQALFVPFAGAGFDRGSVLEQIWHDGLLIEV